MTDGNISMGSVTYYLVGIEGGGVHENTVVKTCHGWEWFLEILWFYVRFEHIIIWRETFLYILSERKVALLNLTIKQSLYYDKYDKQVPS